MAPIHHVSTIFVSIHSIITSHRDTMDKQPLISGKHADDDTIVIDGEESNGGGGEFRVAVASLLLPSPD
jgi:hypothetical protein